MQAGPPANVREKGPKDYRARSSSIKLAGIIFGGGIGDIDTNAIMGNIGNLEPAVLSLVKAVRQDSMADYYDASLGLSEFLTQNGINIPLSPEEIYVLLILAGPLLVDTNFEPNEESTPEGIVSQPHFVGRCARP